MKFQKKESGLLVLAAPAVLRGRSLGQHRTCDTAIAFRMGMGFPGDVNRGHPASIQPALNSPANPIAAYGQPCVIDTANSGVRPIVAADQALTEIWGVVCRPYPIQQATSANQSGAVPYGAIAPPTQQPVDVVRGGYVMVAVNILNGSPVKGGAVFIWAAASGGGHTQGGFEGATGGGINTMALALSDYQWNSPPDSNGVAELILNKF
jgi:hypothetical protein